MCAYCGGSPCDWEELGKAVIIKTVQDLSEQEKVNNNRARKLAYMKYTYESHGCTGQELRVQLLHCVMNGIRDRWYEATGE